MDTQISQEPELHPAIAGGDGKPFEGSGKDVSKVSPPIVSVNRSSGNEQLDKVKHKVVTSADEFLCRDPNVNLPFPFGDLKTGEGMFIPNDPGMTTDKHMEKMYPVIWRLRQQFSEIARDEHGDEIWEQLTVKIRKKNDDGTIQLEGNNKPIEGANFVQAPKLIPLRDFTVKAVVKDDDVSHNMKAESDGVIVIRVI